MELNLNLTNHREGVRRTKKQKNVDPKHPSIKAPDPGGRRVLMDTRRGREDYKKRGEGENLQRGGRREIRSEGMRDPDSVRERTRYLLEGVRCSIHFGCPKHALGSCSKTKRAQSGPLHLNNQGDVEPIHKIFE